MPRTFPKEVGDFATNTHAYDSANDRIDILHSIGRKLPKQYAVIQWIDPGNTGIPEAAILLPYSE